jgi:Uma2 family endonuclease
MDVQPTQLLEPDDLLRMPDGDRYELIDGVPVEKSMGAESDRIALRLGGRLDQFCLTSGCGLAFGSQTGYRCFPNNPRQVRKPDVSFVARGRLEDDRPPEGDIEISPDLAVEVVSPNDTYEEIQTRIRDYKSARTRLIWVISPKTRTVLIRLLDGTCAEVGEGGELSGEDVIPGFACKVADLFI